MNEAGHMEQNDFKQNHVGKSLQNYKVLCKYTKLVLLFSVR